MSIVIKFLVFDLFSSTGWFGLVGVAGVIVGLVLFGMATGRQAMVRQTLRFARNVAVVIIVFVLLAVVLAELVG